MNRFRIFTGTALVLMAACAAADAVCAAESIFGPVVGFTRDSTGAVIRPIIGIPGAAALAEQLHFEVEIRGAVISPNQDYAVAVRSDDGSVVAVSLKMDLLDIAGDHRSPLQLMPIAGSPTTPSYTLTLPNGLPIDLQDSTTRSPPTISKMTHGA